MMIEVVRNKKVIRKWSKLQYPIFCQITDSAPIVCGGKFRIRGFDSDRMVISFQSNQLPQSIVEPDE